MMAAGSFVRWCRARLPDLLNHVTAGARPHDTGNADALAALNQHLGERERDNERAVELGLPYKRRGEHHGRGAVGPDPHRVRRLPFLLAHVKMIVAGRASPVDPGRRFARYEAAVLPEILAWTGAAAAMQPVNHGCRDAARFEHQSRHSGGECTCLAERAGYCTDIGM
jgi:hypothetical protein